MNQPPKSCGTCRHAEPREMTHGELLEIRCGHPLVRSLYETNHVLPDWINDLNAFEPFRHGQHCDAWEITTDK